LSQDPLRVHEPRRLSSLIEERGDPTALWSPDEMSDVLRHQLEAPLAVDLALLDPEIDARLEALRGHVPAPPRTFGELLRHPRPPLDLLVLVKEFGKRGRTKADPAIPPEVATVLYVTSIILAFQVHGVRSPAWIRRP